MGSGAGELRRWGPGGVGAVAASAAWSVISQGLVAANNPVLQLPRRLDLLLAGELAVPQDGVSLE